MRRPIFGADHEAFRQTVRAFYEKSVVPQFPAWEAAGHPPREFWRECGDLGLLGIQVPEEYGGGGVDSFRFNAILTEETQHVGVALGGLRVHTDICMPYFLSYSTVEQRARWLTDLVSGTALSAIAMSEPQAGSDLRAITTTARLDGDHYVVNGAKTFISNAACAELIILVVKIGSPDRQTPLSLLVVDSRQSDVGRGRQVDKIGLKGQDVAELFFDDMRVPAANLLGEEGHGFEYLTANLAQERLSIAINSQSAAATAVRHTVDHAHQRVLFQQPLASFQNTKFELAACATEVEAGQALVDRAITALDDGDLSPTDAAMVKLYCTEMQGRVIDRCLQLYGGYGYIREYPIARAYMDARAARLYAGSSEVMKVIIAKGLGL
jgi:alkylation response protein AidB-like acyl-CoA dehydrogenase